ncbi:putative glycosyltransferase, exosortase G system-associated [Leuconostoc litchii]|uniref:Putative glycosyltransferase, exosortase G system-associated n=1 Tax=Leuconostoc litchii TaxID=1981069 RepID=A0A6P2CNC9_9LACO|nr:TIGR03111 family XrtG-associated glycosyltransferase [Leuconostoc litchii]TYC47084.1 putative glycosyltransferase, exosortase G system-associated [Leuconostoc litchii]GMA69024.1 putative glycosyltransferase, exosortase G system-associated [Leuconostoc litchii]
MNYIFFSTLNQMGFWITWLVIPILVETLPAILAFARIFIFTLRNHNSQKDLDFWPYISIIVPVYNSEDTLYDCVQSINQSTYPSDKIQVILVDNQSTDNSFKIFQKTQKDFQQLNIQWMKTEKGKARALNSAIYNSTGMYIVNIDSDGILETNALKNLISKFEGDMTISAMTGCILTQKELIKRTKNLPLKWLQRLEYFEYAQAFISGRNTESRRNHLYTMSGAFSGFRKEALMKTFMYDISTVGEDIDITFQVREKSKGKVMLCADAFFFVDPIESWNKLYMQRQRWQRGQIEVSQKFSGYKLNVKAFFSNFLVRRLIIDHTFLFLKTIWLFASISLLFLNYSPLLLSLSYLSIYILYVFMSILVYTNVCMMLKRFPAERKFYFGLFDCVFLLPIYNFILSWVRLIGVINTEYFSSKWTTKDYKEEFTTVKKIVINDLMKIKGDKQK